jgi:hypothetical protein
VGAAADAVAGGEGLGYGAADVDDSASVVAAGEAVGGADAVGDVFPVGGVESDGVDFDEDLDGGLV